MPERLTFTLAGRDELSRVLNNTADASDRLRLRMAGITGDADGRLRDLQGRFLTLADAQRRVDDQSSQVRRRFDDFGKASEKLGEKLKANLISLLPAAIPASAALAQSAAAVAAQFGAGAVAAGAYALALKPQIAAIGEAVQAQTKYEDAVRTSGATSQQAIKAQTAYQQSLDKLPPATQQAAVAVGLLKDNYQKWSDSLAGDVMGPFNKGVAIANDLLPKTTGLVKGASTQFDRLVTELGGAISTPGFDKLTGKFTTFADDTLDHAVDKLNVFLAKAQAGDFHSSGLVQFLDQTRATGPKVFDTLENVGDALLHVLQAGNEVGVGMLDVINALSGIVSAVPPGAIATFLQLAIAIKAVKLAAAAGGAAKAGLLAIATQVAAMNTAATATPGRLAGVTAAIGSMSKGAKLAVAGTGIGLLLIALSQLSSGSRKPKADVDKLTTSLGELGNSGKVTGEALRVYGKDLSGLGDALQTLAKPSGLDKTQQFLTSLIGMDSTPVKDAKEAFDGIDKALAGLVSQGNADLAAAALGNIEANLKKQGFTAKEVEGQLNDYKDALAGQALEQQLAAQSMGLFGTQAQTVQAQLDAQKKSADGLRQSIQALNETNRSALDGQIGFEAAIDAASKAAKENAGVLDMQGGKLVTNTDKQRAAAQALSDLAAKTDSATASARESGASWSEVSSIYQRGRAAFIKSAEAMGLTRAQAKALADQILKTPNKTAYLRGNLQDLQAKLASAKRQLRSVPDARRAQVRANIADLERKIRIAKDALNNLDGYSATTWIYTNYSTPHHMATGGLLHRAHGGPITGFPGGGRVRGPGTSTSDSILLAASDGEYVINAMSTAKYLPLIEAINRGELPTGRAVKPGAAATPMSTSTMTGSSKPAVTYNVYPRASVIDARDLQLLQRQEEARQRVGRPE